MHRVDQFHNLLAAVQAADHLLAHGVIARVFGDRRALDFNLRGIATYDVYVFRREDVERARELLSSIEPIEEIDWETELAPDLSRLDPALAPACPVCGETLPLDAEACPACAEPVDVPELIAAAHGPEALAPCYDVATPAIDERRLLTARLHCSRCHYSLEGLSITGHCPECGAQYDKREIVRSIIR